jgi:hypothetical protein
MNFSLSLWERDGVRERIALKYPLILDRLFPTRSTASIPGGVSFSLREKEPNRMRWYALFAVLLSQLMMLTLKTIVAPV